MSLEHLVVAENKKSAQEKKKMMRLSNRHRSQLKGLPMFKAGKLLATK